jgi:hypothetical protein
MEPHLLNPRGAIFDPASVKIKSRTHTEHQARLQTRQHLAHEQILPRCADSYPEDVRLARPDPSHKIVLFRSGQFTKRRRTRAGDARPRELPKHIRR